MCTRVRALCLHEVWSREGMLLRIAGGAGSCKIVTVFVELYQDFIARNAVTVCHDEDAWNSTLRQAGSSPKYV